MKVLVIIATAMIAAGVILSAVGVAFGGFRSVHFGSGGFYMAGLPGTAGVAPVSHTFDGFDGVDVDVSFYAVTLKEGDVYGAEVKSLYARETPEVRVADGVLTVYGDKETTARERRGFFGRLLFLPFRFGDIDEIPTIEITYPRGARIGGVNVKSDAGSVEIEKLTAATVSVECMAGSLEIEETTADELRVKLNAGGCEIKDTTATVATVELDAGSFSARDFDCGALDGSFRLGDVSVKGSLRGDVNITADMGSVFLETDLPESKYLVNTDVSLGSVTVGERAASGGDIDMSFGDVGAPYTISVKAAMGSVEVDFD
ncbi:MAG: DUF4097 domain-containing protein [Clostridiales Family XIII bacterium]|nr:DUF4097 domain-containing protein [Clostridiales Family XIII bacterium]